MIVAGVILVMVSVGYATIVRPFRLRETQIRNLVVMRSVDGELRIYREAHGVFPRSLENLPGVPNTDQWGTGFLYRSDGREYILVSYGSDSRPDGSDYLRMRAAGKLDNLALREFQR